MYMTNPINIKTADIQPMTKRIIYLIFIALILISTGCENDEEPILGGSSDVVKFGFFYDSPAWHPDGKWIAVRHGDLIDTDFDGIPDTGFSGIWIVNAETGYKQPLIRGFDAPAWSPDGQRLAVDGGGQIFIFEVTSLEPARIDSNSILQLTSDGANISPAWSPDGNWIAYLYSKCGGDSTCGTWLMDTSGDQKRFLFLHGLEYSWHPFDPLILYTSRSSDERGNRLGDTLGVFDIRTNRDESIRFLSEPNHSNRGPKYSPDGREIAITSKPRASWASIWIMRSDGSRLRQLTKGGSDLSLDWSPDGGQIVFLRWSPNRSIEGNGQLWVINTDGTNLRQLTFNR